MTKKVLDWNEINDLWLEHENLPDIILNKVNILDVLDKFGIEYINTQNGEFSHKLRCPFPSHSGGNERTASMFVSMEKNSFYCFGCNAGNNVINFTMKMLGCPFQEATKWLVENFGIDGSCATETIVKKEKRDPEKTIIFQAFKIGKTIREHLEKVRDTKDYNKWLAWADKKFKKVDLFLDNLSDDDWQIINEYYIKTKSFVDGTK